VQGQALKLLSALKTPVCEDLRAGGTICKKEFISPTGSAAQQLAQSVLLSYQEDIPEKGIQDLYARLKSTGRTVYKEHDGNAAVSALAESVTKTILPSIDHLKSTVLIFESLLSKMDFSKVPSRLKTGACTHRPLW